LVVEGPRLVAAYLVRTLVAACLVPTLEVVC